MWENAVNESIAQQRQNKPWLDEEVCEIDINTLIEMEEESIKMALNLETKNPKSPAPTKGKSGKGKSRGRGRGVLSKEICFCTTPWRQVINTLFALQLLDPYVRGTQVRQSISKEEMKTGKKHAGNVLMLASFFFVHTHTAFGNRRMAFGNVCRAFGNLRTALGNLVVAFGNPGTAFGQTKTRIRVINTRRRVKVPSSTIAKDNHFFRRPSFLLFPCSAHSRSVMSS
jgi:hypothetical protein